MDGAKGEEYFSWDFKVKLQDMECKKDVVGALEAIGFKVTDSCQNEVYFKK